MKSSDKMNRRNFIKASLIGAILLFINFSGWERLVKSRDVPKIDMSQIGLLYSLATGVVLRTINPGPGEDAHLDWVENNLPEGTSLLRVNKMAVGADDHNVPNLDFLIPFAAKFNDVQLAFGKPCSIINADGVVVDTVLACPVLYRTKLAREAAQNNLACTHQVIEQLAAIGDVYDHAQGKFASALKPRNIKAVA